MNINQLYNEFYLKNASEQRVVFDKKLISTKYEIKGVKTALLEAFAKSLISKGYSFEDLPFSFHEDISIAGMVLVKEKNIEKKKSYLKKFLNYIDNWATCDMIACRLKNFESEKDFIIDFLFSKCDFEIRFAIVWLKSFILKYDIDFVLKKILLIKNDNYFVKMGQAWTIAEGFAVDFEKTLNYLKTCEDDFVFNKSIQKACESFRIEKDKKEILKTLKKKIVKSYVY